MYLGPGGAPVPCPDPAAGLHVRTRGGAVVRVAIPPEQLAFQMGEAMQVHSGGLLRATPHCVRAAAAAGGAAGVSREAFALFLQPGVAEPMDAPPGVGPAAVAVGQWSPGLTFGEFSDRTFAKYYAASGM
jgi:isopenicillin N synthase-like dioxygenase